MTDQPKPPEGVELTVTLEAKVLAPAGTRVSDTGSGFVLPDGTLLKFWPTAELVDHDGDVYQDLDTQQLMDRDVHYEVTVQTVELGL